jgi:Family of unknown function (DUF5706)
VSDTNLEKAIATTLGEIGRTDEKAALLFNALGLPLAVLIAAVPGRSHFAGSAAALLGVGVVSLVLALLVVLLVVRPRVKSPGRGSFLHWADCTPDEVVEDLADTNNRVEHLVRLSRIAKVKFLGLRIAVDITVLAFAGLAAALITTLT